MNVLINMQHAHAPCLAQFISAAQQIQTMQIRAVCVITCDAGRIPTSTQSITVCLRKVETQMEIKNHENNSSFRCTSFLASTQARTSIAIKDTVVLNIDIDQILSYFLLQLKVERRLRLRKKCTMTITRTKAQ